MQQIFPDHKIIIPKDEGIDFDPEETGCTFYENSLIKAKALYSITHTPVIADDSGLCVDILNGAPGVYSSRYAGPMYMKGRPDNIKISQDEQNKFLIQQVNDSIKKLPKESPLPCYQYKNGPRSCRYVCSMVLLLGSERIFICQETMEGILIEDIKEQRGTGGFGYDPIVLLPSKEKTIAELSADEKNAISHRGKAARAIRAIIESLK